MLGRAGSVGFFADTFGRLPPFCEGIGPDQRGFCLRPEDQRPALPNRLLPPVHAFFDLDVRNAVEASQGRVLHPLRDIFREVRGVCDAPHPFNFPPLGTAQG